jgi:hypothetical protein
LADALAAGRTLLGDPEAVQAGIDAAAAAIWAAVTGLVSAGGPGAAGAAAASVGVAPGAAAPVESAKAGVLKSHRPKILGKAVTGKKLRAVLGSWSKGTKVTYRWYRNGKAISGATGKAYVVRQADAGKRIVVKAVGTKTGFAKVVRASEAVKIKR